MQGCLPVLYCTPTTWYYCSVSCCSNAWVTTDTDNLRLTVALLQHIILDRTEAVYSQSLTLIAFVSQEQKSIIDVCEHMVCKCLEYLIFVIKKRNKSPWLIELLLICVYRDKTYS